MYPVWSIAHNSYAVFNYYGVVFPKYVMKNTVVSAPSVSARTRSLGHGSSYII